MDCLVKVQCDVGEGPLWDAISQALYWIDMTNNQVFCYHLATKKLEEWALPKNVAAVFPTADPLILLLVLADGLVNFHKQTQKITYLCQPEITPGSVFNDAKQDSYGRIWAVTKASDHESKVAGLYCFTSHDQCKQLDQDYVIGNGLGFSLDNSKFYCSDSVAREIYCYPLDMETLSLGERQVLTSIQHDKGLPDGLCVDAQGNIWTALWDGWCIQCYLPSGELKKTIDMPIQKPTSLCIGGNDMQTLFITSARYQLNESELAKQTQAGAVFALQF